MCNAKQCKLKTGKCRNIRTKTFINLFVILYIVCLGAAFNTEIQRAFDDCVFDVCHDGASEDAIFDAVVSVVEVCPARITRQIHWMTGFGFGKYIIVLMHIYVDAKLIG